MCAGSLRVRVHFLIDETSISHWYDDCVRMFAVFHTACNIESTNQCFGSMYKHKRVNMRMIKKKRHVRNLVGRCTVHISAKSQTNFTYTHTNSSIQTQKVRLDSFGCIVRYLVLGFSLPFPLCRPILCVTSL